MLNIEKRVAVRCGRWEENKVGAGEVTRWVVGQR
jgi:hypothetical protein